MLGNLQAKQVLLRKSAALRARGSFLHQLAGFFDFASARKQMKTTFFRAFPMRRARHAVGHKHTQVSCLLKPSRHYNANPTDMWVVPQKRVPL